MQSFNVFLPLSKAVGNDKPYEVVSETNAKGIHLTRYKLKGIASTTSLDRDHEIVSAGCIKKMSEKIKLKKMPIFGNHDHSWENMLGYSNEGRELNNSLEVEILTDYAETNPKVAMLIGKLDAGLPLGLSIGGKVLKNDEIYNSALGKNVRVIEDVELLETSIVGIGANPDAFLSLSQQIAKSLKKEGEDKMELNKSAGQSGELSYGKLGETTPEARCPYCGKPSELRGSQSGTTLYFCQPCGTQFSVENSKGASAPVSQPENKPAPKVGEQTQPVLGEKGAKLDVKKGESMEDDKKPEANESEDKKPVDAKPKEEKGETEQGESPSEVGYESFKANMSRYLKEVKEGVIKAEGMTVAPGMENADSKNTVGGSGDAKPVHQKSGERYESMKKAFSENLGAEGIKLEKAADESDADLSFKGFRYRK